MGAGDLTHTRRKRSPVQSQAPALRSPPPCGRQRSSIPRTPPQPPAPTTCIRPARHPTLCSEAYPHLIFDGFGSALGKRLGNILKHLFPVPKDDAKRVVTFANRDDYVSFRHHTYTQPAGPKSIELKEVRSRRAPRGRAPLLLRRAPRGWAPLFLQRASRGWAPLLLRRGRGGPNACAEAARSAGSGFQRVRAGPETRGPPRSLIRRACHRQPHALRMSFAHAHDFAHRCAHCFATSVKDPRLPPLAPAVRPAL